MPESQLDHPHRCLSCGYSLTGLPDPPRCPECGLLNIPDGYRKQVWDLIDSGRWFFSSMFRPFQKRPPGWWWALDREGDIDRSYRFLLRHLALTVLLVPAVYVVACGFVLERTHTYTLVDEQEPNGFPTDVVVWVEHDPIAYDDMGASGWISQPDWSRVWRPGYSTTETVSTRVVFHTTPMAVLAGFIVWFWTALIWAFPSLVGIWTQIRKGLPAFAIARRTIVAACNYESHRILYNSLLLLTLVLIQMVARLQGVTIALTITDVILVSGFVMVVAMWIAVGWVGPLRSDPTKQLVRSRWHLFRVVFMYAFFLPIVSVMVLDAWIRTRNY